MRRLFVPGYYSGFSNNKMSLDIAIVLAYLTGRVLVPYRFRLPRRFPVDLQPDRVLEPMLVARSVRYPRSLVGRVPLQDLDLRAGRA